MSKNEKLRYESEKIDPVRLIGKKTTVALGKNAVKFVTEFREGGALAALAGLSTLPANDFAIWMGGYDEATKSFTELPCVFAAPDAEVPEGYDFIDVPACTLGKCFISGPTRNLSRGAHNKLLKLMKEAGAEPDYSLGFSMEYYSYELYGRDKDAGEDYTFVYILPVK